MSTHKKFQQQIRHLKSTATLGRNAANVPERRSSVATLDNIPEPSREQLLDAELLFEQLMMTEDGLGYRAA